MASSAEQIKKSFYPTFPKLEKDILFDITSPQTDEYNCIAWAMGFNDRWVDCWPEVEGHWWPPIEVCDLKPESLVKAFEYVNFVKCKDCDSEDGFEKVALYMLDDGINPETGNHEPIWTHASRVLSDKECHSKMGQSFDVHHSNGDIFEGSCYGHIYAFMKRKLSDRQIIDDIISEGDCDYVVNW